MIPAVIVPVLNRFDLLRSMLGSIDHTITDILVIDNNGNLNPGDDPDANA